MRQPPTKPNSAPVRASTPVTAPARIPVWLMAALLALVTIGLYWPATRCGFVSFDDPDYVTANPHVQGGLTWAGAKWAFCNTEQAAYWAPMLWLSHQLACQLFGMNPWGHHLINVLLHAINTVLVFLLFRRMTGATGRSLVVAALFGLHPLRVESVAWISERKDVLCGFFFLLTLWAYARYVEKFKVQPVAPKPGEGGSPKSKVFYGLALVFFALGLMSKPMIVTLPFVLLLLDYWPLKRVTCDEWRVTGSDLRQAPSIHQSINPLLRLLLEKLPFFGLSAISCVVTFVAQKHGGTVASIGGLSLGARSGNALISYCRYLGKLFWPVDMAVFYPHPGKWPVAEVLLAGGLLLGITVLCFVMRRRYPFMLVGWLWFVGTLVPVIGLVQAGWVAMADRFTYIPSLGVLMLTVWSGCELSRQWRHQVMVLSVAGGLAIAVCVGLTRQQLGYWQDTEILFRHALAVTKDNYLAHNNLGSILALKGHADEAISQYREAIRLKPNYASAHYNLGTAFGMKGRTDEALGEFQETIRLKPDDAKAHYNLGVAYSMKGRADEAIGQYQEALRLKPDYGEACYNLGVALGMKGRISEAISQLQEAVRLVPDDAEAHNNLGTALGMKGRMDEAISQYQEALRLKPDFADARNNLARMLAIQSARRAADSNPR